MVLIAFIFPHDSLSSPRQLSAYQEERSYRVVIKIGQDVDLGLCLLSKYIGVV